MTVRPYATSDLAAVVQLFTAAVHTLAQPHYTTAQLDAWAPQSPDDDHWRRRLGSVEALVAEEKAALAGFIAYAQNGHIDLLYVSPSFSRRGAATLLYRHAEAILTGKGVTELVTEASVAARPFFERQGFRVLQEQHVSVRGATLLRYAMTKTAAQQHVGNSDAERRR